MWKDGMTNAADWSFQNPFHPPFNVLFCITEARKLKSHFPHSFAAKVLETN